MRTIAAKADDGMSLTGLNLFGLFAVTVMVTAYALEAKHSAFVLVFAASCVLASVYGFLQGAWPFGMVEGIWSVIAARRWWMARPGRAPVNGAVTGIEH
jgi:hypothetical protein